MKDLFSEQADQYAKYRPSYPIEFYEYLNSILSNKNNAWDCGTGNGQVAIELAKFFEKVYATDISQAQLENAIIADNIEYSAQAAESSLFENDQFDLVIVAQAIHWFNFQEFYKEVKRTGKRNGLICVLGYGKLEISKEIDPIINHFYQKTLSGYWDKERKYIDENYETIPFPFTEIKAPKFANRLHWTLDHLISYLNTWTAVKHYIHQNGHNPVDRFKLELENHWPKNQMYEINFPILLRIGFIK